VARSRAPGRAGGRRQAGLDGRARQLPALQLDFNPIENALAKLKALLRKAAERTLEGCKRLAVSMPSPHRNAPTTSG
jgi:hypothetical protein